MNKQMLPREGERFSTRASEASSPSVSPVVRTDTWNHPGISTNGERIVGFEDVPYRGLYPSPKMGDGPTRPPGKFIIWHTRPEQWAIRENCRRPGDGPVPRNPPARKCGVQESGHDCPLQVTQVAWCSSQAQFHGKSCAVSPEALPG